MVIDGVGECVDSVCRWSDRSTKEEIEMVGGGVAYVCGVLCISSRNEYAR